MMSAHCSVHIGNSIPLPCVHSLPFCLDLDVFVFDSDQSVAQIYCDFGAVFILIYVMFI